MTNEFSRTMIGVILAFVVHQTALCDGNPSNSSPPKLDASADLLNADEGLQCGVIRGGDSPIDGLSVYFKTKEATKSADTWRLIHSHRVISVSFPRCVIDASIAENLGDVVGLRTLRLDSVTATTPDAMRIVGRIHTLRVLHLGRFDCDFDHLRGLTRLQSLHMEGQKLDREAVRWVSSQPLHTLFLWDCEWPEGELHRLAKCRELKHLTIDGGHFNDADSKLFCHTKSLQVLNFTHTRLGPKVAGRIAVLKNIRDLGMANTNVSDEDVKKLSACKSLKTVSFESTRITDDAIEYLSSCDQLQILKIGDTPITGCGFTRWFAERPRNRTRFQVHANGSKFNDHGLAALSSGLPWLKWSARFASLSAEQGKEI